MTPITNLAVAAPIAAAVETAAAEGLLRDVAYVLKLTRRVKDEMSADRARTERPAGRTAEGVLVA